MCPNAAAAALTPPASDASISSVLSSGVALVKAMRKVDKKNDGHLVKSQVAPAATGYGWQVGQLGVREEAAGRSGCPTFFSFSFLFPPFISSSSPFPFSNVFTLALQSGQSKRARTFSHRERRTCARISQHGRQSPLPHHLRQQPQRKEQKRWCATTEDELFVGPPPNAYNPNIFCCKPIARGRSRLRLPVIVVVVVVVVFIPPLPQKKTPTPA